MKAIVSGNSRNLPKKNIDYNKVEDFNNLTTSQLIWHTRLIISEAAKESLNNNPQIMDMDKDSLFKTVSDIINNIPDELLIINNKDQILVVIHYLSVVFINMKITLYRAKHVKMETDVDLTTDILNVIFDKLEDMLNNKKNKK